AVSGPGREHLVGPGEVELFDAVPEADCDRVVIHGASVPDTAAASRTAFARFRPRDSSIRLSAESFEPCRLRRGTHNGVGSARDARPNPLLPRLTRLRRTGREFRGRDQRRRAYG